MILKRIGVLSCGKIAGIMYAIIGLFVGGMFSLVSIFGTAIGLAQRELPGAVAGVLFGVGAVILLPIFYGVLGFFGGLLCALIYNALVGAVGGIEVELQ